MENSPVLLVSALALLAASLALMLCALVLLVFLIKRPTAVEKPEKPVVLVQPKAPVVAAKPKRKLFPRNDGPKCDNCGRMLPEKPTRGVESEEGSFLVYQCKCGKETTLAANNPPNIAT